MDAPPRPRLKVCCIGSVGEARAAVRRVGPVGLDVCSGVRSGGALDEAALAASVERAGRRWDLGGGVAVAVGRGGRFALRPGRAGGEQVDTFDERHPAPTASTHGYATPPFGSPSMRLILAALVGLFAVASARAQPSPNAGPYGVFGNASPERLLFPTGTAPVVSAGWQLSPRADVHVGYRGRSTKAFGPVPPVGERRLEAPTFLDRARGRTGTASAGYAAPLGRLRAEVRASVAYESYGRTRTDLSPAGVEGAETERVDGRFVHTGASAVLTVPLGGERGGAAPGVGLAVTRSEAVGGTLDAQRDRWMPFVRVPVGVRVADAFSVTLELTGGAFRHRPLADGLPARWTPVVDGAVRVGL